MANKYLGYRYLDKDSLTVTTYKLKYWTSFASDDLYMGAMKSGDSVIYVGAKDKYVLASTGIMQVTTVIKVMYLVCLNWFVRLIQ